MNSYTQTHIKTNTKIEGKFTFNDANFSTNATSNQEEYLTEHKYAQETPSSKKSHGVIPMKKLSPNYSSSNCSKQVNGSCSDKVKRNVAQRHISSSNNAQDT